MEFTVFADFVLFVKTYRIFAKFRLFLCNWSRNYFIGRFFVAIVHMSFYNLFVFYYALFLVVFFSNPFFRKEKYLEEKKR